MSAGAFLLVTFLFLVAGLVVLAVTAWMERSDESKAKWDAITERVFR